MSTGRRETARYDLSDLPTSATEDSNILSGAAEMQVGSGTKESGTYRKSGDDGSISTVYVPDSPQTAVYFGLKVVRSGGRFGFCQDKVGSLKKGKPITQSLWIKGTKGVKVMLQAWWVPALSDGPHQHSWTLTGDWQWLEATETPADNYNDVSAGYVYLESDGEAIVVAEKVEEGARATPWPHDAIQAAADEKAAALLKDSRSVIQRENFTCTYDPISVYDAGNIRLASAGVDADHVCIRTQTISFKAGCPMDIEARKFERSAA